MMAVITSGVVLLAVFAFLLGVPRVAGTAGPQSGKATAWPDVLAGFEGKAGWWLEHSRLWDVVLGVLTIVALAAAVSLFQDAAILGGMENFAPFIYNTLAILGLAGLFTTTYLGVRRAGLHGAEATFIGAALVGVTLIVLASALLLQ